MMSMHNQAVIIFLYTLESFLEALSLRGGDEQPSSDDGWNFRCWKHMRHMQMGGSDCLIRSQRSAGRV